MRSLFEEIGLDRVKEIMAEATQKAANEANALEIPHAVEIGNSWYAQFPDGRIQPLDDYLALEKIKPIHG